MANKVGTLIKEARTAAGLTQEQLAKKMKTLTASDISKAERGQKELTTAQLREIAKITGVTQKSLLDAAAGTSAKKTTTANKTDSGKKTTAKKTASSTGTSVKLTATEKKVIELYREADSDTKKAVMSLLKGEDKKGLLASLLGGKEGLAGLLGNGKTGLSDLLDGKKVNELLGNFLK